jgi:hypothetical protein
MGIFGSDKNSVSNDVEQKRDTDAQTPSFYSEGDVGCGNRPYGSNKVGGYGPQFGLDCAW